METPLQNYNQLKIAKGFYNDLSFQGFVINVANSYKEGIITEEEKNELLSIACHKSNVAEWLDGKTAYSAQKDA